MSGGDGHRSRSIRGGAAMVSSHALQFALGLGSAVVLARLLTPEDFGVFAMAAVVLALARSVGDFGVPMAVVQQQQLDPGTLDRLYWLNLRWNAVLAAATAALAPAAAAFFGRSELLGVVLVLAVAVLLHGATNPQLGLMRRAMSFAALARLELVAQVGGVAIALGVAFAGGGYWALVAQQATALTLQAVGRWLVCGWVPRRASTDAGSDATRLASLLRFGKYATYARILGAVGREIDRVLVGRLVGAGALGLYHNAQRWAVFPVRQLHLPLLGVAVASFSRLQDEPERYARYARLSFLGFFAAVLPVLAFVALEADDFVPFLLGPQWTGAVPLFRVLAIGAMFFSATRLLKWVYLAEGRTRDQLLWSLIATPITIAALVAGTPWAAEGVAAAHALSGAALLVPGVAFCLRRSRLPRDVVWRAGWRPALASAGAAGVLAAAKLSGAWPDAVLGVRLLLAGALFSTAYVAVWFALPGGRQNADDLVGAVRALRTARAEATG